MVLTWLQRRRLSANLAVAVATAEGRIGFSVVSISINPYDREFIQSIHRFNSFLRILTLISLNSSMHPLSVSKNHEMCVCLPGVSSARAEAPQLLTPSRRQLFRVRDQGVPTEVFPKSLGWQWGNQNHQREGKQRIGEKAGNHSNLHYFFSFISVPALFSTLSYSKMNLHLPRGKSWPFPFHSMRKRQIYISGRSRCWCIVHEQ